MAEIHVDRLLETCIRCGASDLHLHVGLQPCLRLHGRLRHLETKVLEPNDTLQLMKAITPDRNQQELQEQGGTDFGFSFGDAGRFRVSVYRQRSHISMALRLIPNKLYGIDDLGLPGIIPVLLRRPRGLILVTGPTGSGKTTTLATMVNYINQNFDKHIITIEDPIEFYFPHSKSMVSQREVGSDVPSFSEALRRVLRMDPDVIMVGEMRDLETIEAAIMAAETGHLVFGTLHTTGCQGTVNRIIDVFPVAQQEQIRTQLSVSLIAVLSQQLCRRVDKPGMVAAFEFMAVTSAIANLIRENKTYRIDSAIQVGKKYGMQLLDEHLWNLFTSGKIGRDELLDKARAPGEVQELLDKTFPGGGQQAGPPASLASG